MRLIDADALKEIIETYRPILISSDYLQGKNNMIDYCIAEIDNAPTVERPTYTDVIEANKEGFNNARRLYERPQGEWLDEKYVAFHLTCNNCGCHIRKQKEEVFEGNYNYNFCPNCGADMRKGGAEMRKEESSNG